MSTFHYQIDQCIDVFDYKRAMTLCYKALNSDPNNERVLETAGAVLLENEQTDEASKISLEYNVHYQIKIKHLFCS